MWNTNPVSRGDKNLHDLVLFCLAEMTNNGVIVVVAASTRTVVPQGQKLVIFTSVNFIRWKQRVFFMLTTLSL